MITTPVLDTRVGMTPQSVESVQDRVSASVSLMDAMDTLELLDAPRYTGHEWDVR